MGRSLGFVMSCLGELQSNNMKIDNFFSPSYELALSSH